MTSITPRGANVGFVYDTVGRRSILTLANWVSQTDADDGASRLTGAIYRHVQALLGDLNDELDVVGRRTAMCLSAALRPEP